MNDGIPQESWVLDSLSQVEALTSMFREGQEARKQGFASSSPKEQTYAADMYDAAHFWHRSARGEINRLKAEYPDTVVKHNDIVAELAKIAENKRNNDVSTGLESRISETPLSTVDTVSQTDSWQTSGLVIACL